MNVRVTCFAARCDQWVHGSQALYVGTLVWERVTVFSPSFLFISNNADHSDIDFVRRTQRTDFRSTFEAPFLNKFQKKTYPWRPVLACEYRERLNSAVQGAENETARCFFVYDGGRLVYNIVNSNLRFHRQVLKI